VKWVTSGCAVRARSHRTKQTLQIEHPPCEKTARSGAPFPSANFNCSELYRFFPPLDASSQIGFIPTGTVLF
jgi:hypothetical protein